MLLGSQIGGLALGGIGQSLGGKYGGASGSTAGKNIGTAIGSSLGAIFPYFLHGGPVKRTGKAIVHKGEYVLPKNAKPTKAQKAVVAKNKAKARKGKM